tara:strand:+ start:389 stop:586 length:198 start_codon:yes stop_codon:yes gene_type:complete
MNRRNKSRRTRRKAQRKFKQAMRGELEDITGRNWLAVSAHFRRGGAFKDRRAHSNKMACRRRVEA